VEAEALSGIGGFRIRVTLNPLEEPIDHAHVVVKVRVQRRAEAMEKAHGPEGGGSWSGGTGLPESGLEGPKENVKDGAGGPRPVMEEGSEALGYGEDPLADGHVGNDMVHQVSRGLGHALGVA
jgi:hypothetical protein